MTCRIVRTLAGLALAGALISGCAVASPEPASAQSSGAPATRALNSQEAQRLQRLMTPLVLAMNKPRRLDQVKIGITDDAHINAASGGGGAFYVTTGLLQKASDLHLAGVLAHELAHD